MSEKKLSPDLDEEALAEIMKRIAAMPKLDKDGDPVGNAWWSRCRGCDENMNPRPRWLRVIEGKKGRKRRFCDVCRTSGVDKLYDEKDYEDD